MICLTFLTKKAAIPLGNDTNVFEKVFFVQDNRPKVNTIST